MRPENAQLRQVEAETLFKIVPRLNEFLVDPSASPQQASWVSCAEWMTKGHALDLNAWQPLQVGLGDKEMRTVTALGKIAEQIVVKAWLENLTSPDVGSGRLSTSNEGCA